MDHWSKICMSRVQSISVDLENVLCLNMTKKDSQRGTLNSVKLDQVEHWSLRESWKKLHWGKQNKVGHQFHPWQLCLPLHHHGEQLPPYLWPTSTWRSCNKQSQDSEDRRVWSSELPCNSWDWLELEWHAVCRKRSTSDPKATGIPTPVFNSHTTPTSWDLPPTNSHK